MRPFWCAGMAVNYAFVVVASIRGHENWSDFAFHCAGLVGLRVWCVVE